MLFAEQELPKARSGRLSSNENRDDSDRRRTGCACCVNVHDTLRLGIQAASRPDPFVPPLTLPKRS